jgi:hypothetical protein
LEKSAPSASLLSSTFASTMFSIGSICHRSG